MYYFAQISPLIYYNFECSIIELFSVNVVLDIHGLSDEEGSSEVFLTTDSDYDSSRAQSPRELDLLPTSPMSSAHPEPRAFLRSEGSSSGGGGGGGGGGGDALRTSTPDVLQGSESGQCGGNVGGGGREGRRRTGGPELFDSDFILPSRQIELLRITEKRQAYCVRTSSLEFPAAHQNARAPPPVTSPAHSPPRRRWPRPSSVDRCCGTDRSPRQPPARTLSEDSGTERLSALSPGDHRRGWHATLRVYPQYPTGLPKDTSVKVGQTARDRPSPPAQT